VALPIELIRTHVPLRYKVTSIGWKDDPALLDRSANLC
jgi:hypothetical protein